MRRAVLALALALALIAVPSAESGGGQQRESSPAGHASPAVQREWRARAWAFDPDSAPEALPGALLSPAWDLRHMALDALARSPAGVRWARARGVRGADDAHPNVRAAALELSIWTGRPLDLTGARGASWAAEPSESVRRALARHLALHAPHDGQRAARLDLLAHLAARVGPAARVARAALFSAGPGAARHQLPLLLVQGTLDGNVQGTLDGNVQGTLHGSALLEGLPLLERATVDPALVQALREHLPSAPLEREALATLVECLALHGELDGAGTNAGSTPIPVCDRDILVAGWLAFQTETSDETSDGSIDYRAQSQRRALLVATAREGDEALGRALMRSARELDALARGPRAQAPRLRGALSFPHHADQAQRHLGLEAGASFLAECAADALTPRLALELAAGLSDELAGEVWNRVAHRVEHLDPESTARWLQPDRSAELRFGVASVVADVFRLGDPMAETLLLGLLHDPDSGIRRAAFAWLCDERGLPARLPALHAAWLRYDAGERILHLRSLSRRVPPTPFLPELLEICRDPAGRTPGVLELLGSLRQGPAVREALEAWREEELAGMEAAPDLDTYRRHEWRAKALVQAGGPHPPQELAGILRRSLASSPILEAGQQHRRELPKACAALLGTTPAGRAELTRFLGSDVARRTRIEAAIQIGGDARLSPFHPRALKILEERYAFADSELGLRMLAAAGRLELPGAEHFLEAAAADPRADLERRLGALTALGRRGADRALARAGLDDPHPEVVREVARLLGILGGTSARTALRGAWSALRARRDSERERPRDRLLAGEFLLALATAGDLSPRELGLCFEEPLRRAGQDLAARFAGEHLPATEFQWRTELDLARLLARRGHLDDVLAAAGAFGRADGRLLVRLAALAAEGQEVQPARALARAAFAALAGEAPAEGLEPNRTEVLALLVELAVRAQDWEAAGAWADRLYLEARLTRGLLAGLEPAFPAFDRLAGRDPWADLDAARHQARAWAALERKDLSAARDLVRTAGRHLGISRSARKAQVALQAALGESSTAR